MMIEPESGIAAPNQELFKDNKILADDNKKAEDYGIKAGTVLYMEPKTMTIKVDMPDGTQQEVEVSPSDTTDEVKKKIEAKTGVKAPTQVLKHNGKDMPADKKLKDMGIRDGDTIKMELLQVPVKVKTKDGKVHDIMVAPTDTVKDIKKLLEAKTGVPAGQQVLIDSSGKELDNDNATADDVGIKAGSVLTLQAKAMKITIELPDGTTHLIEIDALDQSKQIEAKLSKTGCQALSLSKDGVLQVDTPKVFGKK
jgi:Ubiquitin family